MTKRKPWKVANPEQAAAMRELRRSGAAGPHADRRTRRARTRKDRLRREIRDAE